MASLNQCEFIGNVGKQPEVRYSPSGDAICNFSVAVNEIWRDKTTGERKETTEWVRCVAYRKLGEICGEYLKSGSMVWVQGKLKTRKYQDKQTGQDRYTTEIVLDKMQMLGGRDDEGQGNYGGSSQQGQQQRQSQRNDYVAAKNGAPAANLADMDDDIPF